MLAGSSGSLTIVCVWDPRQVCTPGSWHRVALVADVEDPDAAEALRVDRAGGALAAAVDAAAGLLDRHEEQVAVDRHVTLAARAHEGAAQGRVGRVGDVVELEAVEVAHDRRVAGEGEVGVHEPEVARRLRRRAPRAGRCRAARCCCSPRTRGGSPARDPRAGRPRRRTPSPAGARRPGRSPRQLVARTGSDGADATCGYPPAQVARMPRAREARREIDLRCRTT